MKIAVIGAGFCGLAVCWRLLQTTRHQVTLFDPRGIGGEASGISAGLLHPYAGLHSKLNWRGLEGMAAAKELLAVAENALGKPVADYSGILRPAFTAEQIADFQLCASRYSDVEWLTPEQASARIPGLPRVPALFIPSGITVDSPLYLEGLWKACERLGAQKVSRKVNSVDDLQGYDTIAACLGASTPLFRETQALPLSLVKGQILELEWPAGLFPLPCSLNSQVYVTMLNGKCMAGSTYERGFINALPDQETAKRILIPKIEELYPPLREAKILGARAGIRAVTPNHIPSLVKHSDKLYSLTGLGSKGLLYHALMAQQLVELIEQGHKGP